MDKTKVYMMFIINFIIAIIIISSIMGGIYEIVTNSNLFWTKEWNLEGRVLGIIDILIGILFILYYHLIQKWFKKILSKKEEV